MNAADGAWPKGHHPWNGSGLIAWWEGTLFEPGLETTKVTTEGGIKINRAEWVRKVLWTKVMNSAALLFLSVGLESDQGR